MFLKLTPVFLVATTLFVNPGSAEKDPAFRRFLSSIAQKEAQAQAGQVKFPINQGGFRGQLELPNPEKIQVEITEFQLKNDTITAGLTVQGDCRIAGVWTQDGQSFNVKADMTVKLSVTGSVLVEVQNGDFFFTPKLTDCDFKVLRLRIQEPGELADGDALLTDMANTAFQKNKDKIIKHINGTMKKYQIKF